MAVNLRKLAHSQRVALWENRRAVLLSILAEQEPLDSELLEEYAALLHEREVRHAAA